jgi:hypothetical protein
MTKIRQNHGRSEFMAMSEFEIKRIEKLVGQYIETRRPPMEVRDQVDLSFRVEKQSVIIFEIREVWNDRERKVEIPIAKATYVKSKRIWKLYWQRADQKWHGYEPTPETESIEEFLSVIEKDEWCCFWG